MFCFDGLIDRPDNKCPPRFSSGNIKASDGISLRWARFDAIVSEPLGTVLLLQGRGEYIEKWFEVIAELQARGFSVLTFDWRGQGGSQRLVGDGQKGYVQDFSEYSLDLEVMVGHLNLFEGPYYLFAHSTGALIAIINNHIFDCIINKVVLTSPFLGGAYSTFWGAMMKAMINSLDGLGFSTRWIPGGGPSTTHLAPFERNDVTSDRRRYGRNLGFARAHPELVIGSPTVRWAASAISAFGAAVKPRKMASYRLQTMVVVGSNESVVSREAVDLFVIGARVERYIVIQGARHEILQEQDWLRQAFWDAFDLFMRRDSLSSTVEVGNVPNLQSRR